MQLFDTHAHLDMKNTSVKQAAECIERAHSAGVSRIVAIAGSNTPGNYEQTFELVSRFTGIWTAVGVHPHAASEFSLAIQDKILFSADREKVVAIGEIGLDYHYNFSEPKTQRTTFIKQLRLAKKANRKVIIHTRKADEDTLAILQDEGANTLGGVIHCFSSGETFAEGALNLGFYLSFSGIITFPKASEICAIAQSAPIDRILVETDSPYLSPVPLRGRTNEPAHIVHIVDKLTSLRKMSSEDMAQILFTNANNCFGLSDNNSYNLQQ